MVSPISLVRLHIGIHILKLNSRLKLRYYLRANTRTNSTRCRWRVQDLSGKREVYLWAHFGKSKLKEVLGPPMSSDTVRKFEWFITTWLFHFSDKSPKTAKIEKNLLPLSAKIGCDVWLTNWLKLYSIVINHWFIKAWAPGKHQTKMDCWASRSGWGSFIARRLVPKVRIWVGGTLASCCVVVRVLKWAKNLVFCQLGDLFVHLFTTACDPRKSRGTRSGFAEGL